MTDKLKKICDMCKCSVSIIINDHRNYYKTAKQELLDLDCLECPPEISEETRTEMIKRDAIVNIKVYPDTPISSYDIYHWDLNEALDKTLSALEQN